MAFLVEDGTGLENANALVSVAELDTYLSDRAIDTLQYTEAQKQAAIVSASVDYADIYFTFYGDPLNADQGMQLPTDEVEINARIKNAICAASLLSLRGRLFVDPTEVERQSVISSSDAVGPVSTSKTYSESSQFLTKYPTSNIDKVLGYYAVSGGISSLLRG